MMGFIHFRWGKYPNAQWKSSFIQQKVDTHIIGYTDLKEVLLN